MGFPGGCVGLGSSRGVYGGAWGGPEMKGSAPGGLQGLPKLKMSVLGYLRFCPMRSERYKYVVLIILKKICVFV